MSEQHDGIMMIQFRRVTPKGNVNYKTRPATDAEIAAAHPKCCDSDGVPLCGHVKYERVYTSVPVGSDDVMTCKLYGPIEPNHYCPHHTALREPEGRFPKDRSER